MQSADSQFRIFFGKQDADFYFGCGYYRNIDTIIFQFPNAGSREAEERHNPNFILVRDFLKSAAKCLRPHGKVLISAVDNPYYRGAFQFDDAAETTNFELPRVYPFDPSKFPGYSHINTNDEESAIEKYDQFSTWVFTLQR